MKWLKQILLWISNNRNSIATILFWCMVVVILTFNTVMTLAVLFPDSIAHTALVKLVEWTGTLVKLITVVEPLSIGHSCSIIGVTHADNFCGHYVRSRNAYLVN